MTTRRISRTGKLADLNWTRWLVIGLQSAVGAIVAVLLVQAAILAIWPELSSFKPLDSYARSALFTLIPAAGATAIFAWLVKTREQPIRKFLYLSAGFLLLSFLPDYLLPIPDRTLAGSTTAAFLHLVAGIIVVTLILLGYDREAKANK